MEALVHLAVLGERRVLAVLGDDDIVRTPRVDECVRRRRAVGTHLPSSREHPDPGLHHLADLSEGLPLRPFVIAPTGHVAEAGGRRQVSDLVGRRPRDRRPVLC